MRRLGQVEWYRRHADQIGIALLIVIAAASIGGWVSNSRRDESRALKTHAAICALRSDLQQRHASGVAFLKAHPHGIPGITAVEIQRSLASQQSTIDALAVADCAS